MQIRKGRGWMESKSWRRTEQIQHAFRIEKKLNKITIIKYIKASKLSRRNKLKNYRFNGFTGRYEELAWKNSSTIEQKAHLVIGVRG